MVRGRNITVVAAAVTVLLLGGTAVGIALLGRGRATTPAPANSGGPVPLRQPVPGPGDQPRPEPRPAGPLAEMLKHTGHGLFVLAPAGSPDCMRKGALVQRDKAGVFVEIPGEMEGQARTFGPWYGRGPADELFRIKVLRPCTIYMLGGSRTGGAEWKARGWTHSDARVLVGDPAGTKRESLDVWRMEAEPGELKLARDRHNFMMNFVFVPRDATAR